MKRVIFILLMLLVSITVQAQFVIKGGMSYAKYENKTVVVTGQYNRGLLVVSSDVLIPTINTEKVSAAGRVGVGIGVDLIRFVGDVLIRYENEYFRCGYGGEINLNLVGPFGVFTRWSRTYPIIENCGYPEVFWKCGRNEFSFGLTINLTEGGCF